MGAGAGCYIWARHQGRGIGRAGHHAATGISTNAQPSLTHNTQPLMTSPAYHQWEDLFTYHIEILFNCDRSDAQGIVEANQETVEQLFGHGLTPEAAAFEFSTMQRDF
jgi:hypothetical protein